MSLRLPCRLLFLALLALGSSLQAQTLTGTAVADPAVPTVISPSPNNASYFVLNQDLSLTGRFGTQASASFNCPAPAGFSPGSATPRTLLNDGSAAYFTAQGTSANAAASATYPLTGSCKSAAALTFPGGTPTRTFTTNNPRQGVYQVLESFAGNGPDTLTIVNNLNSNQTSTPVLTQKSSVTIDTGGTYSAMVTDTNSSYGLTAITEMRTATSAGGLFIYSPGIQTVFKILGPGGTALPAIGAFLLPARANDNGSLLVLVNQDNLTSANLANPPAVTSPFTIIDLGQLQRAFSAVASQGTTVTLPASLVQIPATTSYYAMLGATYSPVFHLLYALVASGTSSSSVTQSIIRYDPTTPLAPAETVVADVSNIPFTFGTYPQLTLNAAAGSMDILSAGALYHVSVAGKGNTATQVTGTPFPDSNFKPTYIASNPLLGETYIASASQVDILTLSGTSVPRATLELFGTDNAIVNQSYTLYGQGVNPTSDVPLNQATVTITGTPAGGSPVTLGTTTFANFAGASTGSTSFNFPAAGIWTVVASVPATGTYPSFSSLPLTVGVGATGVAAVYPTTTRLVVPSTSTSTTVTGQLTLFGGTYAPTGRIIVSDASGNQVGRYNFTGGSTTYPVNVTLTLPAGNSALTAVYNGDTQNQTSTSPTVNISVGNQFKSSLGLSIPSTASTGATLNGTVFYSAAAGATGTPTGNILIQTSTGTTLATIPVATPFANPTTGTPFTFTAPAAAGTYSITANYAGDASFSAATSAASSLVTSAPLTATTTSLSAVATATVATAFPVTIRLANSSSSATPTGNVTLTITPAGGSGQLFTTITAAQALASGGYIANVTLANAGSYTLTASYAGDTNFAASSGTIVVAVKGTFSRFDVSVPATQPIGSQITGTLYVTPSGSTATPSGSYVVTATQVSNGAVTPLASIPAALFATATNVNFQYTGPSPAGLFRVDATYAGDTNFTSAAAPSVNFNAVNPVTAATAIVLSAPANYPPSAFSVNVTLTAKSPVTTTPPTGSLVVTYLPAGGSPVNFGSTLAATAYATGGTQITGTIATPGTYALTATYAGDANYAASAQTGTIIIARSTPTLTLTGPTATTSGTAATYNVALTGFGIAPLTGITITSAASGTTGPSASVSGNTGSAVLTFINNGTYTVTASFLGDANTLPATATLTTVVTGGPVAGIALTLDDPTSATVPLELTKGNKIDVPFTLKAVNGYSGTVSLSAAFLELDGANAHVDDCYYTLVDANGKQLSSTTTCGIQAVIVTPTAAGVHLQVRVHGVDYNGLLLSPFRKPTGIAFASLFLGCGLLGWRRRRVISPRLAQFLLVFAIVAGSGALLAGCSSVNSNFRITLVATPTSTTATPQTTSFLVHYVQ